MRHIILDVVPTPAPEGATIFELDSAITGEAGTDLSYECGSCGEPLMVGIGDGQVKDIVLHCFKCGSYNRASS